MVNTRQNMFFLVGIIDDDIVGAASLAFAIRASFNLVLALIRLRRVRK